MRVLIVDDERRARERLTRLLAAFPAIQIAGEAENGLDAVSAIQTLSPDVIFLDIQMPGLTGFEVVGELPQDRRPRIVFVTAYDEYALRAFEVSAVDYLLKPVEEDRLARAIAKLQGQPSQEGVEKLLATVQRDETLQRIVGKRLQKLHVLQVSAIEGFLAEDELVFAVTRNGRFLVNSTLQELESRLDSANFSRVHKQAIVNLSKIVELEPILKGGATARLESGESIEISRRYSVALRKKLNW